MPKRVKKTDQNKAWNKVVKPVYQVQQIRANQLILITCEGQTEKLYFESFPVLGKDVRVIDLKGQADLKLVESTITLAQKQKYDQIWCVFDLDVNQGEKEFADFDNSIVQAQSLGYKVAYSNDSFELWFYLHYQYSEAEHHRSFYYGKLSEIWGISYENVGKKKEFASGIYELLQKEEKASQSEAIKRSKKLHDLHKKQNLPYHKQNPTSLVYELVELLNENLRE
ncbi:RloB family protein [Bernardetia sp. ABR2-2B]|uniref:RloB family protein n=1 Tax=Bernardetia sp. ABR2-2B TaxID=3127472 RepID=UPI0030CB2D7A